MESAEKPEKRWYVVHTYSGYENRVKANLESREKSMGMTNYIFRVVVPATPERVTDKKGKKTLKMDKTFPGYVIVEMIMTDQSWYIVRNTPGVTGFLGSHGQGSKPVPLLNSEVKLILDRLHEKKPENETKLNAKVGDTVTITAGAFSGLSGKITNINADQAKLNVNINMFGRETNTQLKFGEVKPVE
ncbi:transcription termination/antitermination protein NusG [Acetilactobacillus jinshanensis]|uniref:Transcription termination/antitermination protein NusG n=1 Tax=Acetilactobacillus jinshanensis TaxID=1720083 RepID=A0A4P6ZLY6_9LACO|nr:transcription termination/antitermination protein NusG [Acetilactobacillus jinshanensis]QBP18846.1 transcription termination/antitermination factor NusG [Acetilactobacillus jinshanensis]URL61713.1 transcription termination/antitermination factor NusG [uncultured bacterium]